MAATPHQDIRALNEMVLQHSAFVDGLIAETQKVIVGQKYMIERALIGLITGGHILIEGVPGLAKTLTVKTLADTLSAKFSRIQFTPDMLPADVVGTTIYNQKTGDFSIRKGPVFANLVLADEINRAPAKVQSALLEAMQEKQVTIGEETFQLPKPFIVMATENPVEQEGTYPLPEAQVDRFMLKLKVNYPAKEEERQIMDRMCVSEEPKAEAITTTNNVLAVKSLVEQVYVDEKIKDYIVNLIFATREPKRAGLKGIAEFIEYGASPRATIALLKAARAHAFLRHRGFVTPDDVKAMGMDVLRHRISLTYEAEAEEMTPESVLQQVFDRVEVP